MADTGVCVCVSDAVKDDGAELRGEEPLPQPPASSSHMPSPIGLLTRGPLAAHVYGQPMGRGVKGLAAMAATLSEAAESPGRLEGGVATKPAEPSGPGQSWGKGTQGAESMGRG